MTTANLSVGLNTSAVKAELDRFKAFLRTELGSFRISIDANFAAAEVQKAMKSVTVKVALDQASLTQSAQQALTAAFNRNFQVRLDTANLTSQVQAAVAAGMSGAKLGGVAAGGAPVVAGAGPDLKVLIQQILTPAVDELAKAATLVGGTARKIGTGGASGGALQATSRFATTDPTTGERVSVSRKLADPEGVLAGVKTRIASETQLQQELADLAEMQRISNETFRARRAARRFEERAATDALTESQRSSNETFRARRTARVFEERAAAEAAAESQRSSNETFRARRTARRFEEDAARRDLAEQQRSSNETFRARQQARAFEEQALRRRIQEAYASARVDAAQNFKGAGIGIAAAQTVAQRFGTDATAAVLGPNAGLLQRAGELDRYRRATDDASAAKKRLRDNMNDAHSAARGLAGSLGALWVTWGSTAPLVAAAAIGAALRTTYSVGKDVEYQLKFVSALSDGAAVSIEKFGDATRGSLMVPVQSAEGLRALAQNGLNVRQALAALPDVLNLATVGEMGMTEAALGATGVLAAFNLQVTELGRVSDVFAKAAAMSNTSVGSMVESMKQASTVADQYHVSLEETAASLAIMAKRNIIGTAAGTAMRNMLVELATPHKKAKDAMQELGLQLYDTSGQLRGYGEILAEIRAKTVLLNEKGRLTFLNEVFGERGAKAANAILTDFDQYQRMLDELKNKSKDFAASVSEALKETTQGKVKALVSEFQLSAVAAFDKSKDSVNSFIDSMRAAVASEEFKNMLQALVKGVTSLTTYLIENGKVIAVTVGLWMGLRVAESLATGVMTLVSAVRAFNFTIAATGIAARAAFGAITGGVGLVAMLAAEFLLLRKNTNEALEAQNRFGQQLDLQISDLERQNKTLAESNALLARRVELMRQGRTGSEADAIIDSESNAKAADKFRKDVDNAVAALITERKKLEDYESWANTVPAKRGGKLAPMQPGEAQDSRALVKKLEENLAKAQKAEADFQERLSRKREEDELKENDRRLYAARKFNARLKEISEADKTKKINVDDLRIDDGALSGSKDEFDSFMKAREESLNKRLGSLEARDPQRRTEELAATRALIKELNAEKAAMEQSIRFRKELDEARFNERLFGPQLAALLAEQRAVQGIAQARQLELDQVERLRAAMGGKNLTDADRKSLQAEIDHRSANIELLRRQMGHEVQLNTLRGAERARQQASDAQLERAKLAGEDSDALAKMRQQLSTKVEDSASAADAAARLAVQVRYRDAIVKREQDVLTAKAAIRALEDQGMGAAEDYTDEELKRLNAAKANLSVQEAVLLALTEQARVSADIAGLTARKNDRESQTAEYGFKKFWKEYQEQGLTAAKIVEQGMKSASDKMTDALATFVTTGKLNFKSLVASILEDLAKLYARRAFGQLLQYVIGAVGGAFGGGGGAPGSDMGGWTSGGGYGTGTGVAGFAGGGIMTSAGRVPLRMYDAGGVARSPQAAIFAEGRKPEAYVPLNDGRSIPVTIAGGGTGGATSVSIAVHVHQDGRTNVDSQADGEKAAQLGKMIEQAVTAQLVREKRPGGILY